MRGPDVREVPTAVQEARQIWREEAIDTAAASQPQLKSTDETVDNQPRNRAEPHHIHHLHHDRQGSKTRLAVASNVG